MIFNASHPVSGSYTFCFTTPGSTTKTTPGTVSDVSAMFVATTMRRHARGGAQNTLACASGGSAAYSGRICASSHSVSSASLTRSLSRLHALSISSWPVRNSRISPGPWLLCRSHVVSIAVSKYDRGRSLAYAMSTGKTRPGTWYTGQSPK